MLDAAVDPLPWQRLPRKFLFYLLLKVQPFYLIFCLIPALLFLGTELALSRFSRTGQNATDLQHIFDDVIRPIAISYLVCIMVLWVLHMLITFRRYRNWRYALREQDLLVSQGALFQRIQAMPYGRIQTVTVTTGPLQSLFGICSLKLISAGLSGTITLSGISRGEGQRLREYLLSRSQAQLAGL